MLNKNYTFVNKIYIIVPISNFGDFNFDESLGITKLGKNDISVKIPPPPKKKYKKATTTKN